MQFAFQCNHLGTGCNAPHWAPTMTPASVNVGSGRINELTERLLPPGGSATESATLKNRRPPHANKTPRGYLSLHTTCRRIRVKAALDAVIVSPVSSPSLFVVVRPPPVRNRLRKDESIRTNYCGL